MCGLAGFFTRDANLIRQARDVAAAMTSAILHRGPDAGDAWIDESAGIVIGHRRLAIIDLSAAGQQPMASRSGRYVLAFNGEIYNHLELRIELERHAGGVNWRGHSDTETLLAGFEHWGVEATLRKAVGMFAITLWDRNERALYLARDRFGEKPLYYGWVGGAFAFASELKALRAIPGFANDISREALAQYLRFMYVPAPRSIYRGIYKLEPGCLMRVAEPPAAPPSRPLRPPATHEGITVRRWWSLAATVEAGATHQIVDETQALQMLEERLLDAVKVQSISDVPLGAFLSGGVDSSTIVAMMQAQSSSPIKTFTIGFEEAGFDESPHARAVARHLGTQHSEMRVSAAEARAVIPALPAMYDEPFADSSQIPTHLVCRAARQHVTVALSGDAGDELFGGYNRYFWGPRIWNRVDWMPFPIRRTLGSAIASVPVEGWDSAQSIIAKAVPRVGRMSRAGDKAHKLAARLRMLRKRDDLYLSLVSEWQSPADLLVDPAAEEPRSMLDDPLPAHGVDAEPLAMMYRDAMTYLPDDILCKVDRAAMATSLETRVPFLDHRVAELAWRLPLDMKIRGGQGKWALRQVLYKYVPRELIERPKAGFAIPVGNWIRGPLREWAEDLLDESALSQENLLRPSPIRQKWNEHLSGRRDHTPSLWAILMFEAWRRSFSKC